jgi:hypothetical protein
MSLVEEWALEESSWTDGRDLAMISSIRQDLHNL